MRKKRRKKRQKVKKYPRAAIIIIIIGLIIMMYPVVSNAIAVRQQENVIVGYEKMVLQLDDSNITEEWKKADIYNQNKENYAGVLNLEGDGVMGYIKIPKIDVNIPIYHYVKEQSLKKGVGHLNGTGLPIGGKNNHPVLLGHRGLPNAKLFSRLDEMEIGDYFYLNILDRIMAYEVKQITIVLPEEVHNIKEEWNKDQVTLVTCTPYGVNTHRLLVTGERTDYIEEIEEEQEVNRSDRNIILILLLVIVSGIVIILYPFMTEKTYDYKIKRQKNLYFQRK